jgi:hypothetical protein
MHVDNQRTSVNVINGHLTPLSKKALSFWKRSSAIDTGVSKSGFLVASQAHRGVFDIMIDLSMP